MVPDSFAKRKHVRPVRRGTGVGLGALGFVLTTFVAIATSAQTQANPQPAPVNSGAPAPPVRPPIMIPATPVRPVLPAPPPPGKTPPVITPPPPLTKPFPLEVDLPRNQGSRMDLAGYRGGVFLRDSTDSIRFQIRGRLHTDFNSFFDSGKDDLDAKTAASLSPKLVIRRARVEVAADLWRRWYALFGLDFGGQPIANATGGQETSASSPGQTPTSSSGRFAAIQAPNASATLANAYIDYTFLQLLHVLVGQVQAPISMENRTGNNTIPWLERNMAIRSFVVPNSKEMGVMLWGDLNEAHTLSYEFGVFLGDGPNRPQVDRYADFIGRVYTRPWARSGKTSALDKIQIGFSFQGGQRDPKFVGYDYPAITTAFGWVLWEPQYIDSLGRRVHVLPSGGQTRVGGELRIPYGRFDLRSEAYWVNNGTREAIDGFQLKNTERLGNVQGVGYYVQVSAWVFGNTFVTPDPGTWRPPRLDLSKTPNMDKHGVEVLAIFGGIDANYDGASRKGTYDPKTPGASGGPTTAINVHEFGLGANYWHSQFVRVSANYLAYHTVGADAGKNLALVPSNLGGNPANISNWHHEFGMRVGLMF